MKRWISMLLVIALLCAMPGTAVADEFNTEEALDIPEGIALQMEMPEASPEEIELSEDALEDIGLEIDDALLLSADEDGLFLPEDGEQASEAVEINAPEDFEIDENGVLVKYHGPGGDVVIPDSVIAIGEYAFCYSSLTSVVIPDSVTRIGASAFYYCTSLTSVVIPDSVTSIEWYAFYGCSSLTSVAIPNSVTYIGCYAFASCSSLTSVVIPNSVTSIGDFAFYDCSSLTSVVIPESVTSIGNFTFGYCSSLISVVIPDSVTIIGICAFEFCDSLTNVIIPDSVYSIGDGAFSRCPKLTIYGEAGSYAETYANENNIPFVAGSPDPQSEFPIKIGNVNESETKYAQFNEPLEQYILNMDSDKCYPDLAYMLMALSAAAYNKAGAGKGKLTVKKDGYVYGDKPGSKALYHITKAYSDLGFADYAAYNYYSDPNASGYGSDNAAFTIGVKPLSESEALALIVVRGSFGWENDFTSRDWLSNLRIDMDSAGRHYGFGAAADKVYSKAMSFLKKRYNNKYIKSNIRFVITGHSRGAAVANLLAVKLHDAGVPNSRVYDYNFACPDTVRGLTGKDLAKGHENIWNINNTADAVGVIPGVVGDGLDGIIGKFQSLFVSWGKYGTTRFYCNNWNKASEFDLTRTFSGSSSHDFAKYVRDLGKKSPKQYKWARVVARRIKLGVADAIDSIAQAFYPQYSVIDIARAKISVDDQVYTGKPIKPAVTVNYNKTTLKKNTDYTLSYKNNKAVGTATVTVTGKGNYTGTTAVSFRINPVAVTGLALEGGKWQLTARWEKVSGVTGYQLQYYPKSSPSSAKKVTISKANTVEETVKSLKRNRVYCVRIRAYKKVDGVTYWSAWSAKKTVTVK